MKTPKRGPSREEWTSAAVRVMARSTPEIRELVERANNESWNWETCRYHAAEVGLSPDELWGLVKLSRLQPRTPIPLSDQKGRPFTFKLPPQAQRILHLIDVHMGSGIQSVTPKLDTPDDRQRFLISSLYEESIASSQIEGAVVTREIAKEMLRANRPPKTLDERMIVNNYQTIAMLNQRRDHPMTIPLLLEIQSMLTEGTLSKPDAAGRLRRSDESIMVWDEEDNEPLHVPPPASELEGRLRTMCEFANSTDTAIGGHFIHPAVRAIALHFWLGYEHPFVDGNGRTARALFYWSMLRQGYWLAEYVSISAILRKKPKQYPRSFLDTEQDDGDLTYFLVFQLRVVEESLRAFQKYVESKLREKERIAAVLAPAQFNERQQAILAKALSEPATRFTYTSHANSHRIALATARTDLLGLVRRGLLRKNSAGRRFEFIAATDLRSRLDALAKPKTS